MSKLILPITAPFDYDVWVPGSKSIALRQLLMSALASDESTLRGLPPCDDVDAMMNCLERLGTSFNGSLNDSLLVKPNLNLEEDLELDARQSGVSLRLLLAVAALRTGKTSFVGHESLANRPNGALLDALEQLGCTTESRAGRLPISLQGPATKSSTHLDASTSSQFLSALLLIGPRLPVGLTITLTSDLASASYAEGTIQEMERRGCLVIPDVQIKTYVVVPGEYDGDRLERSSIDLNGDASAATYHMALATLHGGNVTINNVGAGSWQGDVWFSNICRRLGSTVPAEIDATTVHGPDSLHPISEINMSGMPDAAPTLMAMAPYLPKPIKITGLETLRHKECDRISCPANELKKAGIHVEEGEDWLKIWPGKPEPTVFETYDDHRMAMSFAVLATKAEGCRISDPTCVNKTYTNFWRDLGLAYVT